MHAFARGALGVRAREGDLVGDEQHEIRDGNTSRAGNYTSLELVMSVRDEAHRHSIFEALAAHEDVKFVL